MTKDNRTSASRHYDSVLSHLVVGVEKPLTRVGGMLQSDLESLKIEFSNSPAPLDCVGSVSPVESDYILGCEGMATRFHFPISWDEMLHRGMPSVVRISIHMPVCDACFLLYDSLQRRQKTKWIEHVARTIHRSTDHVRHAHQIEYSRLRERATPYIRAASHLMDEMVVSGRVVHHDVLIGEPIPLMQGTVTWIDRKELQLYGKLRLALFVTP